MLEFGFEPEHISAAAYAAQLNQYAKSQSAQKAALEDQRGPSTSKGLEGYKPQQQSWVVVHQDSPEAAAYPRPFIVAREYGWSHIVQVPGVWHQHAAQL